MKKPDLTQEQKETFETQFNEIIKLTSEETQNEWEKSNEIQWVFNQPFISPSIIKKLKGKALDKFVTLLNRVNDRRL